MSDDNQGFILVVDDNEMNRDMLSRRLKRQGYDTVVAENGLQAVELMAEQDFDLVLLDIMMPKMNGYEVLEQVKDDDHLKHIPIIMISAVDDLDSVVKCIELGAEDYLFKPFNPVLLKARVRAGLEKKKLIQQSISNSTSVQYDINTSELRRSITQIGSLVTGMIAGEAGPLTTKQHQLLEQVVAELHTLEDVLND